MTAARHVPPPPDSGVRRLPMLRLGVGDRQSDCVNIGDCLRRWLQLEPIVKARAPRHVLVRVHAERRAQHGDHDPSGDLPAHCPPHCASLEIPSVHARLALATYWARGPSGKHPDDEEDEAK